MLFKIGFGKLVMLGRKIDLDLRSIEATLASHTPKPIANGAIVT